MNSGAFRASGGFRWIDCLGKIALAVGETKVLATQVRIRDFDIYAPIRTVPVLVGGGISHQVLLPEIALDLNKGFP